jgi:hypothetical protein
MVKPPSVVLRLLFVVSAWALAMPGFAQTPAEPDATAPAHIAYLDGTATLARDGRAEDATLNLPIVAGDQLRTRDGRAEVVFGDGSVLDVDHFTTLDFLSDDLLRLVEGRVRLTIGGRDRVSYRIDTPSGAVRIEEPGEYRVALIGESGSPLDVEVIAIRGFATLVNDLGDTQVRAGQRAFASASMAPSYAQSFNSAVWDAFDQWAADRRDERTGTTSARYLPDEIRGYSGSFDRHGDWRYEETYGYVWYPRVHVEWRPYYYGRWRHYSPWGWTWIAYDPWGWPTHHYGRWGFRAGAWFWIPSRHWGPAYVYWASAPGYVGWCPLGWNGRPIFSIHVNVGFGHSGYGYYDPYRAWTVVPRHKFASHGNVREYAVPRNRIEQAVPRWTLASAAAPVRPETATRSVTPIYSAGRSSAVRRDGLTPDRPAGGATSESRRSAPGSGTESLAAAPRAYRRTSPDSNVPRATPPEASGVLRGSTTSPTDAPRARARYRDLGPGGTGGDGAPAATPYQGRAPSAADDRPPSRAGYAPRGVPDQAPGYAPRGVPRTTDSDQGTGQRRANPSPGQSPNADSYGRRSPGAYDRPSGGYDRAVRRNPESARPSSPPPASERPTYSRPSAPAPSRGDRPTYSRPPSGGGDRPSRAAPRGGSSGGSRSSSPPPQSNGGERSRRRPG